MSIANAIMSALGISLFEQQPDPIKTEIDRRFDNRNALMKDGFNDWLMFPPPRNSVLECVYESDITNTFDLRRSEMHPATNVAGLWWRPLRPMKVITQEPPNDPS